MRLSFVKGLREVISRGISKHLGAVSTHLHHFVHFSPLKASMTQSPIMNTVISLDMRKAYEKGADKLLHLLHLTLSHTRES